MALRDTMWRVGAGVSPAEFVEAVVDAWRAVEMVSDEEVHDRFRAGRPFRDFRALLGSAGGGRILAVGCGRGFAGRTAAYAASVIRDVVPAANIRALDCLNLCPGSGPESDAVYDLVVTHSLLHFVHDPAPVCRMLRRMVAPGGRYLMANEPNSRYWQNPECVRAMQRAVDVETRGNRLRRWTSPARYWSRLRRMLLPAGAADSAARVNAVLRERLRLTGDLTAKEIVRIIDPNLPDVCPGECAIGSNGLSWEHLAAGPLAEFRVESVRTCGYVIRSNPDRIPDPLRQMDDDLSRRHPLDGLSFSVLWRRPV